MNIVEYMRNNFVISTDPARLDLDAVHAYISRSYWATGRPREVQARAMDNSLCFGVYHREAQIGLARVVTDYATFAYLCDVYILEEYQGQGLGKWLMACVLAHPDLKTIGKWRLSTRDAHGLYSQFGFTPLKTPERLMERTKL
jgi:GNAT superfamily N-acetyltransferase